MIRADNVFSARPVTTTALPFIVVALAGIAARTQLAATHPLAALVLCLWIASDTMMLALVARSPGRPAWHAVLGVFAGASVTVWIGSPLAIREVLRETPVITVSMAIVVLAHITWATVRGQRELSSRDRPTKDRWIAAASEMLPPALVRLAAAELTVIHMALFRWGGPVDVPPNSRPFTYHKHLTPMCATLLILSAIEMAVYHLLIGDWTHLGAVVMFIISDVGFIYLIGLIKSFRFKPILLTVDEVCIRAGFLINQPVPLERIASVETSFGGDEVRDPTTLNASLLAWPNILLRLDQPILRQSLLKRKGAISNVAFRLDDPEPFIRLLRWRLGAKGPLSTIGMDRL